LAGPKIRVGDLPHEGQPLIRDQTVSLVPKHPSSPASGPGYPIGQELSIDLASFPQDIKPGQIVLIDDGNISLQVETIQSDRLICTVLIGGTVTTRKGVNFPGVRLEIPGYTQKDAEDLQVAIEEQVDYVALSFVRSPEDIRTVQTALAERSSTIPVIAKIERPEALTCFDEILDIADGVMIARGDLALELSPEEVPFLQKRIITQANLRGKPVITATQMLESMTRHPSPTRAEASDVANAVLDGTDAVMLSAETSTGSYAVEAVEVMDRIIRQTEKEIPTPKHTLNSATPTLRSTPEAVCETAVFLSHLVGAQAIVVFTESGHTAMLVAQHRPTVPILALTPSPSVTRQLALVWGVVSCAFPQIDNTDERISTAQGHLKKLGLIIEGQLMVIVTGERLGHSLGTNLIKVHLVV
jgi:pyruvate kinase